MTVLSGETAFRVQQMTDEEVVDMCMVTLRKLFPHEVLSITVNISYM